MSSKVASDAAPPRRRRSAAERRAEIDAAAREIALTQGLAAVTLRAIAAAVGVAPALVAHYSPSMDDLVAEVFTGVVAGELAEIRQVASGRPEPVSRVRAVLDALLDGTRDDVTLIWVQSWALGGRNEVLGAQVREQMDAWEGFLAEIISDGVEQGVFSADVPRDVAAQLLGMIDGLNAHALVRWRASAERVTLLRLSTEALLALPRGALSE